MAQKFGPGSIQPGGFKQLLMSLYTFNMFTLKRKHQPGPARPGRQWLILGPGPVRI